MKTRTKLRSLSLALVLFASAALPGRAHAQAMLTFSGGNGAPLTLTLSAPVTYAVTTAGSLAHAPFFDFQGVGNLNINGAVTGTMTYTVNGGAAQAFFFLLSDQNFGTAVPNDVFLYGGRQGVAVGNIVTINAGKLTTSSNFAGAPPANGSFQTFLTDDENTRLTAANGLAVPEPSTWALLGLGVLGAGVMTRRRRAARA